MKVLKEFFLHYLSVCNNKHLMTGSKGHSEFCFPNTDPQCYPRQKLRGTLKVKGEQNSLFPMGPVMKRFGIPPNSKV